MPEMQQLLAQLLILSHLVVTRGSSRGVTGVKIGDFDHCCCTFMTNSHDTDTARIECALRSLRDEKQRAFSFALSYAS